ncbi:alpha/beta fold hydrolase [Nocardia sp. NPDC020380]|uniref:alpha/beta fold hydrolase n=1 Tax=Nocardia sp. NPDC020380 TaxID=3364309 RepID=UPI0037B5551B
MWNHGGLSCGLDAAVLNVAAVRHGAALIAIDRPGIGRGESWPMSSIAQWSDTVAQVTDRLGIGAFAVAGWSGGGPYALACAAAMPRRVRAVAVVGGIAPLVRIRQVRELGSWIDVLLILTARWTPWLASAALRWARRASDDELERQLRRAAGRRDVTVLASTSTPLPTAFREAVRYGPRGMIGEYRRYYGPWGFGLDNIVQPVSIWQGEQDSWVPTSHARRLAAALPGSTLHMVAGAGHLLPLVVADEIIRDLAP